jgi:hypothetical protein
VNLNELNSDDGSGDQENQGTGSAEILEDASENINSNEDIAITEWRFTP